MTTHAQLIEGVPSIREHIVVVTDFELVIVYNNSVTVIICSLWLHVYLWSTQLINSYLQYILFTHEIYRKT